MTSVFGRDYADVYDAIYRAKDYAGEADLIERVLERHGAPRPCRVLDIGCGTGRHAFELAKRGYGVTGIDRSPFMLERARAAAAALTGDHGAPKFVQADAGAFELGEKFAAVLMMFTVLGYQHDDAVLHAALDRVRAHLDPAGLFIFDVWNGLAVLAQRPQQRTAKASEGGSDVTRTSSTRLDAERQLCHVTFEVNRNDAGGNSKNWFEEHTLRYFLPDELEDVLGANGLRLLDLRSFPDGQDPPDERAWNMIGVAKRR